MLSRSKFLKCLGLIVFSAISSVAFAAAPQITVGSNSASVGSATPVPISLDWLSDGTVALAQFNVNYDSTNLTPDITDCGGATINPDTGNTVITVACSNPSAGLIVVAADESGLNVIPSMSFGQIDFDVSSAAADIYDLTVSDEVYGDTNSQPVASGGSTDGQITITGFATYGSNPAAGTAIDFGSVTQGDTDPTETLDIDNIGDANTTLMGSCTLGGANPGTFSLTPNNSFLILQGSGPDTTTITCDSAQAVGVHNATLTCTHDGDNASPPSQSPVSYALSCNIQATPLPEYGSNPAIGSLIDLGVVTTQDTAPTAPVEITNTGAATTTLTGSCSIANNPGGVYSVADGAFELAQGASEVQTVTCDNSTVGTFNGGVLSCPHNGATAADPATYTLNCEVQPVPAYDSTPAPGGTIDLGTTPQNNTPPTGGLDIENVGDPGSTLTGICSLIDDTTPISISGSGNYSVLQGGADGVISLTCDTANDQGNYSDTLSCTDNDPQSSDPHTYTVDCAIGPPDPAVYSSVPAAGETINLTPNGAVPQDTDLTDAASLSISNAASPGDDYLDLLGCSVTAGDTAIITANPADMNADINVGDPAAVVSFSCDTTDAGNYSVTYTCPYDDNPSNAPAMETPQGVQGSPAIYTVQCDVRTAISEVTVEPASGTPLTGIADPGGSAQLSVVFYETADEDVDGRVDCSLADGNDFVIDTVLPADIPAGGSLTVTVTGTDPGDVDSISATLNCTYTDSANTDPGVDVTYPLTIAFGGAARFAVTKAFTDDSDADVTATLTCNTGLPLQQSLDISPGDPVIFVVISFESGLMDCVVTEGDADAYAINYDASGDSQSDDNVPDAPGCHFFAVAGGDNNLCAITNTVEPVDVVIEKEWVIDGAVSDEVNQYYQLTLHCDSRIIDGTPSNGNGIPLSGTQAIVLGHWYKVFDGMGSQIFTAEVVPDYPSSNCWVYEDVNTSGIEVDNGCMDIEVSAGNGDRCTITNTVFFEGIPTLSQYGLALMALLMLGVGMVGFRRFT